jgi:S-adenosylmethionine:tRNA ribosyltransferase-isomerase
MLVLDARSRSFKDFKVSDLPDLLSPGDLLVVNDAATLPASLRARSPSGMNLEIRLVNYLGGSDWRAVLLGEGDWRVPTELRDPPENVAVGTVLAIADTFSAEIISLSPESDRLVKIRFSRTGEQMWTGIYAYGRPIQYSYLKDDLAPWAVQTVYASRPWAVEMPSAGRPLSWQVLLELKRRGIRLARVTHAAGISATGDEDLDAALPLAEPFEIPEETVRAIEATRARGGRVIAVGTTVVRALEGSAKEDNTQVAAGAGETDLVIDRKFRLRIVDGILSGVHDPAQSHFRLLRAFADETTLRRAWRHATDEHYLCHEFGDLCLILADRG